MADLKSKEEVAHRTSARDWDSVIELSKVNRSRQKNTRTISEYTSVPNDLLPEDECATFSTTSTSHSLFSVNTDYSAITAAILVNHTLHSTERSRERAIGDDLVRKVLK